MMFLRFVDLTGFVIDPNPFLITCVTHHPLLRVVFIWHKIDSILM